MRKIRTLIFGVLAVAGAWCAQAESVSYLEPVHDSIGAVAGYRTRWAECKEINWGYNPASGGTCSSGSMTLDAGWYVVSGNFKISSTLTIHGDVYLILRNGAKVEVNYKKESRGGLRVETYSALTIYAQSTDENTMGQLIATGGKGAAGIGSGSAASANCGRITINGGKITATGGRDGAGIGGGDKGFANDVININGGIVTATGGDYGSGIGGGCYAGCSIVRICGGTVTAQGGEYSAGIGGGGYKGQGGDGTGITIYGGTVTATGGEGAAGIGGASHGNCDDIWICGGTVNATGGNGAAGIGSGSYGSDGVAETHASGIYIYDGVVTATGGNGAAGIGGGSLSHSDGIMIFGGEVTANGGEYGAGIGGGREGDCEHFMIYGGNVTAMGGDRAAGIGGGVTGGCEQPVINGGMITATGGTHGAGIGGGGYSNLKDAGALRGLTINGGTVRATAGSSTAYDIGHGNPGAKLHASEISTNFVFTGGSITTLGEKGIEITPTNASGEQLFKTTVQDFEASPARIVGFENYGVNDLYPDDGKLYFWLPLGTHQQISSATGAVRSMLASTFL